MSFKPLRAAKCRNNDDVAAQLRKWQEVMLSVKLDGVRVLNNNGQLLTRKLEVVPSQYLQARYGTSDLHGLDGEMICGPATAEHVFHRSQSAVMSEENPDAENCRWILYDDFSLADYNYGYRYQSLCERFADNPRIVVVPQKIITTLEQFVEFEQKAVEKGFEGVMGRTGSLDEHEALYKFGEATLREGYLWKFKRFEDAEAILVGIEEQMVNNNVATRDKLGRMKRSSAKAGKVGAGMVGTLLARDVITGESIRVGSGLTGKQRRDIWENFDDYKMKPFTYSQQKAGRKNKPRFPVFKAFRDARDIMEL